MFCSPSTLTAPCHSRFWFVLGFFSCSLILTHLQAPFMVPMDYSSFCLQAFVLKLISALPATERSLLSSLFSNCLCFLEPAFSLGYSCMKIIAFVIKMYYINWKKILQNVNIFIYREFLFSSLWFFHIFLHFSQISCLI
uniref:Uncharacterized protein n=1 Tax=Pipistrellus kuhlii TaxID=59472 RepID=A0A7J7VMJ8_PIPKU|nr:hypothetical protein mPipKuh1_008399 [Pipistrellus kuhlii]